MDTTQIERARQARKIYLLTFLFNLIAGFILRITPGGSPLQVIISILCILSIVVATWRFCRALGVGAVWSAINALFSPLVALVQLIVFLRMYAKRTRTGLTFLMGEKAPSRT